MANSKMLASLIGPTMVAIAAAMLLNLGSLPALLEPISHDPALIFLSGILLFVAGLAIVRAHNHWVADWPVLVTLIGWLAIAGGLTRMLFAVKLAPIVVAAGQHTGVVIGMAAVMLAVGGILSFKAYGRN